MRGEERNREKKSKKGVDIEEKLTEDMTRKKRAELK